MSRVLLDHDERLRWIGPELLAIEDRKLNRLTLADPCRAKVRDSRREPAWISARRRGVDNRRVLQPGLAHLPVDLNSQFDFNGARRQLVRSYHAYVISSWGKDHR